jgi:hypothetical protein
LLPFELAIATLLLFSYPTPIDMGLLLRVVLQNTGSPGLSLLIWVFGGMLAMTGALCYIEVCTDGRKFQIHKMYVDMVMNGNK